MEWNHLAHQLLLKVKREESVARLEEQLARAADTGQLANQLSTDEQKKAFWINI